MRRLPWLAGLASLAIPALSPGLDFNEARHLLARTGFGGSLAEIRALGSTDRKAAVRRLLDRVRTAATVAPPGLVHEEPPNPKSMKMLPQFVRKGLRMERKEDGRELKAWWFQEMVETPSPLTERLTLFWHNHFTSSMRKSKWAPLMYRQNVLLRRHALGNFRTMLHALSKDPAMVVYLDNAQNKKGSPNENFAREVMELFTLGEGNYTEKDIKEAARAFTGWGVNRATASFRYRRHQHDYGKKTVLGKTGDLTGEEVLDHLLSQPACARWLTRKLWREFVSLEDPPAAEVERLAQVLRKANYEIRPWIEATLLSSAFWNPTNRGTRIKSPVELLVGTVRALSFQAVEPMTLVQASRQLGQDLFDPPNVKGWPGGHRWISSSSLLRRDQLLRKGLRGMQGAPGSKKLAGLPSDDLRALLLPTAPVNPLPKKFKGWQLLQRLVLDPAYQLQ